MLGTDNPIRYLVSYKLRQARRSLQDLWGPGRFTLTRNFPPLPYLLVQGDSPLYRRLVGVSPDLFQNKAHNLRLAVQALRGVVLRPGEIFSLWRLVGPPTERRGFKAGLMIQKGRATEGIGGGLCQLSNLLHWLALHSDLTVVERHRHSFDLFPDQDRSVPFGTGATILYNYKDLRLFNPTLQSYQFSLSVEEERLKGELLCSQNLPYRYRIVEREASFNRQGQEWWRQNRIWRIKSGLNGESSEELLLFENNCLCRYEPQEVSG